MIEGYTCRRPYDYQAAPDGGYDWDADRMFMPSWVPGSLPDTPEMRDAGRWLPRDIFVKLSQQPFLGERRNSWVMLPAREAPAITVLCCGSYLLEFKKSNMYFWELVYTEVGCTVRPNLHKSPSVGCYRTRSQALSQNFPMAVVITCS